MSVHSQVRLWGLGQHRSIFNLIILQFHIRGSLIVTLNWSVEDLGIDPHFTATSRANGSSNDTSGETAVDKVLKNVLREHQQILGSIVCMGLNNVHAIQTRRLPDTGISLGVNIWKRPKHALQGVSSIVLREVYHGKRNIGDISRHCGYRQ